MTKSLFVAPLSVQNPAVEGSNVVVQDDVEFLVCQDRGLTGRPESIARAR